MLLLFIFTLLDFCLSDSSYKLITEHKGNSFFDGFSLVNWNQGGCNSKFILNMTQAKDMGLINTTDSQVYIGVDYWNKVNSSGRPAIEILSSTQYSEGLFILDLSHMPSGCGIWPVYWFCGPTWPTHGEIDVIENINLQTTDQVSIHTSTGCSFNKSQEQQIETQMSGTFNQYQSGNCADEPGGCSIESNNVNTFGKNFNQLGGGVFALEVLESTGIRIWFFLHDNVPSDITNKQPNPNNWGKPMSFFPFQSSCPSSRFQDLNILFDVYFCGWSGDDPTWKSQCQNGGPAQGQTCQEFVMNNPSYFREAYWLINYLDIYQMS